jgi:hypothetical protein
MIDAVLDNDPSQAKRELSLSLFNRYWAQAMSAEIPMDIIATMAISASLYALVAQHGIENTAEFVEDLKLNIQQGQFSSQQKTS